MKIAFDTSALIEIHNNLPHKQEQIVALQQILKLKRDGSQHTFVYLDAVKREVAGAAFDRLAREVEIGDFMELFDEKLSLSRFPIMFPVMFVGPEHTQAQNYFSQQAAVSGKDASVLADVVHAKCDYFVTTDAKLLRNHQAVRGAMERYGMVMLDPIRLLEKICPDATTENVKPA